MVKPKRRLVRRPLVLVRNHGARNYLPISELVATVLGFSFDFGAIRGSCSDHLQLVVHAVDEGEVFGRRLELASL